ncbi:MAG: ParB N-terminal domain-containing protein [Planctomycetes bacterium]|nr:ParB N-terminal domain-containing protein [Planctomycetota bacterium]
MAAQRKPRRKKAAPSSRGLGPREVRSENPPAAIERLVELVEADGAAVIGSYREPLGGSWQLFVALPIDKVAPTPFQRDLSDAHLKRLVQRIDEVGRFLDPIIAVRRDDGTYWTPNGNHRLHALKELGGKTIVALLIPEAELAYRILALNTEKAHNLREKALEVIRMARDLAAAGDGTEKDHALVFEEPALLTLGICYEQNGRFAGSVYRPILLRTDEFMSVKLGKALAERETRAKQLLELDEAVNAAVKKLKERGFESPYLKSFVVARINFLRFAKGEVDFDSAITRMLASAKKFDAGKIKTDDVARSGGVVEE